MNDVPESMVSTGSLPSAARTEELVTESWRRFHDNVDGEVADYIPALARVSPDLFGISVVSSAGASFDIGDADRSFTIQSVSKPFVFALICEAIGTESARQRLGANATGLPFNSVMAIELHAQRTGNPLVNAGAVATTSLVPGTGISEKWLFIQSGLSRFAGVPLELDQEVYESEASSNERNLSLAWLLDSYAKMFSDPAEATDLYTRQCSLLVTAHDLAVMGATLADGGANPITGVQVISRSVAQRVLAMMATAGFYETSGDWLFDTGLPGKSGVGGGIVTVAPGKGGMGTFAPRLDGAGNSVKGQLATRFLSEHLGLNLFASAPLVKPTGVSE